MIKVELLTGDVSVQTPQDRSVIVETEQVWTPNMYTGSTRVTPTEQAQTLDTHGLILTNDITVEPIPSQYRDMSGALTWMGPGAEYLGKVYESSIKLSQTGYPNWTPSTTAKAIVATTSVSNPPTLDMVNYEYMIRWRVSIDAAYTAGATLKAQIQKYSASLWQAIHCRPYGFDNIAAENFNYNYCTAASSSSTYLYYYKADGTRTWTTGQSYGLYAVLTAATFSNATTDAPTLTLKTPTINARCSTTYFSTASAGELDQANTTIQIRGDFYRIPIGWNDVRHYYGDAIRVLNDGVNAT